MAVVQISKIQIRRGKANNGTGLPQLASGELAWAVDTQELYIGNGAVAEGAPFVGNTKILTELDLGLNSNILDVLQYTYKAKNTAIQTGDDANNAVQRSLQERFDDSIHFNNFKDPTKPDSADYTEDLQRAIYQLFFNASNTKASVDSYAGVKNRLVLTLPAGIFRVTGTIFIPSYTTIIGAGSGNTIIQHEGTDTVFQFINDAATPESAASANYTSPISYSDNLLQPKGITIKGITISTTTGNRVAMQLDAVRDSLFEDISIEGNWDGTPNTSGRALHLRSVSGLITCENNTFRNFKINNFVYAVYLRGDSLNNAFENFYINGVKHGFILGADEIVINPVDGQPDGAANIDGQIYGPRQAVLSNVRFYNVKQHAIYLYTGTGNTISNIKLENVGNDGGSHLLAEYPQIFIKEAGNLVNGVMSDRTYGKATSPSNGTGNLTNPEIGTRAIPFVPEVAGNVSYDSFSPRRLDPFTFGPNVLDAFRLPVNTNRYGNPIGSSMYSINYIYQSNADFTRKGTLSISVNLDNGSIQLSDDYEFAGSDPSGEVARKLDFRAGVLDGTGNEYVGDPGQVPHTVVVKYANPDSSGGNFVYSYSATFIS
jgi:Major tropism determinant N-terminal domain